MGIDLSVVRNGVMEKWRNGVPGFVEFVEFFVLEHNKHKELYEH